MSNPKIKQKLVRLEGYYQHNELPVRLSWDFSGKVDEGLVMLGFEGDNDSTVRLSKADAIKLATFMLDELNGKEPPPPLTKGV